MITSQQCFKKYGTPVNGASWLVVYDVPSELEIGFIPKKIYCNKDIVANLEKAFKNLIDRGFVDELKTWDGCFNIRKKRGSKSMSIHSWALAVDINAFENGFGVTPKLSDGFVKCWTDAGFDWGGKWTKPDGMHFQISNLKSNE